MSSLIVACRGRSVRLGAMLWMLLVTLLLGACAPEGPASPPPSEVGAGDDCSIIAAGFAVQAREALDRYQEIDAEAALADGEELRAAIGRLEALRAEFLALEPAECALPVKVSITRYMDHAIDLHNAVWAADCPLCIDDIRLQATAARERAALDLQTLEGAP